MDYQKQITEANEIVIAQSDEGSFVSAPGKFQLAIERVPNQPNTLIVYTYEWGEYREEVVLREVSEMVRLRDWLSAVIEKM